MQNEKTKKGKAGWRATVALVLASLLAVPAAIPGVAGETTVECDPHKVEAGDVAQHDECQRDPTGGWRYNAVAACTPVGPLACAAAATIALELCVSGTYSSEAAAVGVVGVFPVAGFAKASGTVSSCVAIGAGDTRAQIGVMEGLMYVWAQGAELELAQIGDNYHHLKRNTDTDVSNRNTCINLPLQVSPVCIAGAGFQSTTTPLCVEGKAGSSADASGGLSSITVTEDLLGSEGVPATPTGLAFATLFQAYATSQSRSPTCDRLLDEATFADQSVVDSDREGIDLSETTVVDLAAFGEPGRELVLAGVEAFADDHILRAIQRMPNVDSDMGRALISGIEHGLRANVHAAMAEL